MLCYDRFDVSEGIDINETTGSKELFSLWVFPKL